MNAYAFQNPTGNWSYTGPFHVHITTKIDSHKVGKYPGIEIDGTIIRVGYNKNFPGSVRQSMGGIQLNAGPDQPFYFGYDYLIRICRPNGQLIWENHDYRDLVMQEISEPPEGAWPMFYYDGKGIIGQIGESGPWYQLEPGQEVKFSRHGIFRFTKAFKTLAHLEVLLPYKSWNPRSRKVLIRIPTEKCLFIRRNEFHLGWIVGRIQKGFGHHPNDPDGHRQWFKREIPKNH